MYHELKNTQYVICDYLHAIKCQLQLHLVRHFQNKYTCACHHKLHYLGYIIAKKTALDIHNKPRYTLILLLQSIAFQRMYVNYKASTYSTIAPSFALINGTVRMIQFRMVHEALLTAGLVALHYLLLLITSMLTDNFSLRDLDYICSLVRFIN